jgi:hypothetical protein
LYIRTYIHTYIHTYLRTYTHTYVRTYIHTYIHTTNSIKTKRKIPKSVIYTDILIINILLIMNSTGKIIRYSACFTKDAIAKVKSDTE